MLLWRNGRWRQENQYIGPDTVGLSVLRLPQACLHIHLTTTTKSFWEPWHMPLILGRQRQADLCELKTTLVYIVRHCKKEAREFALLEKRCRPGGCTLKTRTSSKEIRKWFFLRVQMTFCFVLLFCCLEIESHYIAQASLKLKILLLQPPGCSRYFGCCGKRNLPRHKTRGPSGIVCSSTVGRRIR